MKNFIILILIITCFTQSLIIEWVKCPDIHFSERDSNIFNFEKTNPTTLIKESNIELVCSYIKVPVFWENRSFNKTITYFIRKLKAKNRKGQIWSKK
jgi:hypothetical protein